MSKTKAIIYALLAAVFYAINVPVSKLLVNQIGPTTMAALPYLGVGLGMLILSMADKSDKGEKKEYFVKRHIPDCCFKRYVFRTWGLGHRGYKT